MDLVVVYLIVTALIALVSGVAFAFEFFDKRGDEEAMITAARWFVRSPVWPVVLVPALARMVKAIFVYARR